MSKSAEKLNIDFQLMNYFRGKFWMLLCLQPLKLHEHMVKQDVLLRVSAYTAETQPLREDLSKLWNEPSLRRRRCSGILQVDPSLTKQHLEEPRRPCSFSVHQQFTIRAAATTNCELIKKKRHQIKSLTVISVSSNSLINGLIRSWCLLMTWYTRLLHQSISGIALLCIKRSKSWFNSLHWMMQLNTLTGAAVSGSRAPPLAVGRLCSLHAAVAPRRERAKLLGSTCEWSALHGSSEGANATPKWIWAADLSVDCCYTVYSGCKAVLTLRNSSCNRAERPGVCPNMAQDPTIRSGFLVQTCLYFFFFLVNFFANDLSSNILLRNLQMRNQPPP